MTNARNRHAQCHRAWTSIALGGLLSALPHLGQAETLYESERGQLDLNLEIGAGIFHSQRNYAQSGTLPEGHSNWREGYAKLGFSGHRLLPQSSRLFGAVTGLAKGTFGDGDAAGWTNGSERETEVSEAYAGWRSGNLFPALGEDGLEVSAGRQYLQVGDGFLVAGDAISFGNEIADGTLYRGGAYYLAPNRSFAQTAVVRLGGQQGLRGDLIWLKSNNPANGKPELAIGTVEHVSDRGTLGFDYLNVLDSDSRFDTRGRDGVKTYSLRAQGNAGVPGLFLASEYAHQNKPTGNERAWYAEAGWTFADVPWTPSINYRYSDFSEQYDPLFYGNVRGLGTWFQGEVAANYAGPFNSNVRVHHLGLRLQARENLALGVLANRFRSVERSGVLQDAWEVDVYAEWTVGNFFIAPAIGYYKPKYDSSRGGAQVGNSRGNLYGQLLAIYQF